MIHCDFGLDKKSVTLDDNDRLSIFLELVDAHNSNQEHVSSTIPTFFFHGILMALSVLEYTRLYSVSDLVIIDLSVCEEMVGQ